MPEKAKVTKRLPRNFHLLPENVQRIGIAEVARRAGVCRRTVYNVISPNGNPRFRQWDRVVEAAELTWKVVLINEGEPCQRKK